MIYTKTEIDNKIISFQYTREEFTGDITLIVFPLLKYTKKSINDSTNEIGNYFKENCKYVSNYNVIKGFLNLEIDNLFWLKFFKSIETNNNFGIKEIEKKSENIMIEYSSPNTNKPLHLGHIRNNLLGFSVSKIISANGNNVIKVNLVNDRGIHICKSMLAWQKWGNNETPETTKIKGDKLVGNYYVLFDKKNKEQVSELINKGVSENDAKKQTPLLLEAQNMLQKWESGDKQTVELWEKMNNWVYKGFDVTYKKLGIEFDKIYYESQTYKLGKKIVSDGLSKNVLIKKDDNSIWADLTNEGLDQKLLQRSDGTSVYMTQDIGTAQQRFSEYNLSKHIYVVGNEQNYHFQVLKLVLKKLGYNWADNIFHLSYGMVELPDGKMKSREGTVVDADDLIDEMVFAAKEKSQELGKLEGFSENEKQKIYEQLAMGALKYFILKVDPKKNMTFNPNESIDFNGNTGPFIQYTYVRIKSILRKADEKNIKVTEINENIEICEKSKKILKSIYKFPEIISEAAKNYSPAIIANYVYNLAREYNQLYQDYQILKEENIELLNFRLLLSKKTAELIKTSLELMGIETPERM